MFPSQLWLIFWLSGHKIPIGLSYLRDLSLYITLCVMATNDSYNIWLLAIQISSWATSWTRAECMVSDKSGKNWYIVLIIRITLVLAFCHNWTYSNNHGCYKKLINVCLFFILSHLCLLTQLMFRCWPLRVSLISSLMCWRFSSLLSPANVRGNLMSLLCRLFPARAQIYMLSISSQGMTCHLLFGDMPNTWAKSPCLIAQWRSISAKSDEGESNLVKFSIEAKQKSVIFFKFQQRCWYLTTNVDREAH